MTIIDGKKVSAEIKDKVRMDAQNLRSQGIIPTLAVIIATDDPASKIYVNNKKKACEYCSINSLEYALPIDTTEEQLLDLIRKLNNDDGVHGILCQLPLPGHINEQKVINLISPDKDVDAFHPVNTGKIMIGNYDFMPCTPAGIMELLSAYSISVAGRNVCIIGRSNIVGKPLAMLMLGADATVTICHSKTKNLKDICLGSDIIVCATGRYKLLTEDMVNDNTIIIDVGMNRDESGRLCGDVDFENVSKKAAYITPVPGGVGPMTIAMLMRNTIKAVKIYQR